MWGANWELSQIPRSLNKVHLRFNLSWEDGSADDKELGAQLWNLCSDPLHLNESWAWKWVPATPSRGGGDWAISGACLPVSLAKTGSSSFSERP